MDDRAQVMSNGVGNVVMLPKGRRLNKKHFALHLDMSVSWVEKRAQEGMPSEKISGRVRFEPVESEEWLRTHGFIKAKGGE